MTKITNSVKALQEKVSAASAPAAQPARIQKKGATGRPFYKIVYDPCDGRRIQQWAGELVHEEKTPFGATMVQVRLVNLHTGMVSYYTCNKKNLVLTPVYE